MPSLTEPQRIQLDGIVQKMTANHESPAYIQSAVNDFKQKYGAPDQTFWQKVGTGALNIGKDILGVEQNKSQAFVPSLFRQTIGSQGLAGVAQLPGRVAYQAMHPDENVVTPGQALGTSVNAALTAVAGPVEGIAKNLGLTGLKNFATRIASNAALGGGFQVGSNLANKNPVTQDVGLSSALGAALPVAGTALAKGKQALLGQATPLAEQFINSLIKPLAKDFSYGKNPARGILNEGIVANTFDDLANQVGEKTRLVGAQIGTIGHTLDQSGVTLNLTPALAPIDEAIQNAARSNNQTLFHSLQNVKIALQHDLTVGEADGVPAIVQGEAKNLIGAGYNEAKQFLFDIAEHTRFTGNPSDDKALNMATKRAYGVARDIMNQAADTVDPVLGRQIRDLNERYADLLSAKSAINHRDIVMKRQNILTLADRFSIPLSVGSSVATGIITGDWVKAGTVLATELATIGTSKLLGSTAAKTRIAQFLAKLDPEARRGILNSTPVLKQFYEGITGQASPDENAPKSKVLQYVEDYLKNPRLGLQLQDVSKDGFQGFKDLTTKLLEDLKGRSTVSRQYLLDATNRPELKQPERDLFRNLLNGEGDTVNVKDFANKVKTELLPLERTTPEGDFSFDAEEDSGPQPRYENITLPHEVRGPVADYSEHIYQSPIRTSAGDVHFSDEMIKNYFAHSRVEDLGNEGIGTRRVIELQSDLFQKGRLEGEVPDLARNTSPSPEIQKQMDAVYKSKYGKGVVERSEELKKLEPYRNTWHERVIREEVKQAAKDGKTKLQFPTGETAMKIERLGDNSNWITEMGRKAKPEDLEVGLVLKDGPTDADSWIITDVLGDGKFKAVPKDQGGFLLGDNGMEMQEFDADGNELSVPVPDSMKEQFDISGKVDTQSPIYKFYEKEVGRYLTNKYGAKRITDAQGVSWWEIPVKKEQAKLPVEAFGAGALLLPQNNEPTKNSPQ
jgi:hypothetical protein